MFPKGVPRLPADVNRCKQNFRQVTLGKASKKTEVEEEPVIDHDEDTRKQSDAVFTCPD